MCQKVFFCMSTLIVGLLLPEERRLFLKQLLTNSLKLNCCECCIKSESSLWSVTYFSDVRCCLCPCETRFNCDLPLSLFLEIQDIAQMSPARWSLLMAPILRHTFCTFDWLLRQSIPSRGILCHGQGYSVVFKYRRWWCEQQGATHGVGMNQPRHSSVMSIMELAACLSRG